MSLAEVQRNRATAIEGNKKKVVLNPMGYPPAIDQLGMAPRPSSLDRKMIYLIDVHFVDGDKLLQQMEAWFSEKMPKVKTNLVTKSGVYTEDDPKLFEEVRESGGAAVMAIGH